MKSIKRKAPYSIEYKYSKMQKELKKNTLDELGWIDEIEMADILFGD